MYTYLVRYNLARPAGQPTWKSGQTRNVVVTVPQPISNLSCAPAEVIRACQEDAKVNDEVFNAVDGMHECPVYISKAVSVQFRLTYDSTGDIKLRKLTVSKTPRTVVSEIYHFNSSPDVRMFYKFLNRESRWLRWWDDILYPDRQSVPTDVESLSVADIKRDKYGLTTIRVNIIYNAKGIDKSQYRFKAQELVQKELDKLGVELYTGHSLLQCTKGFSDIKKV